MTKSITIPWEDVHDAQCDAFRVISLLGEPSHGKKGYNVFEGDIEGTWLYQVYCGNVMVESYGRNSYCATYNLVPGDSSNNNGYLKSTDSTAEEAIDSLRFLLSERCRRMAFDLDSIGGPYPVL
ncbi:hypothetical protein [Cronobacter muytjensii]|uniref:hypothetical protein n=1 Tax=Cronobacter muytjensii TaxID=413501 RepID=UPI0015880B03|nr:hypothetical protein [Cronobacter muytjensii]NUW60875.1 hypothetical protein [Cronobacter muytjensii]